MSTISVLVTSRDFTNRLGDFRNITLEERDLDFSSL